jgi:hypothetical protein
MQESRLGEDSVEEADVCGDMSNAEEGGNDTMARRRESVRPKCLNTGRF